MVETRNTFNSEKFKAEFPTKLKELCDSPEKVKELAEYLNCSTQAINQYKQGHAYPKIENLIKIAQKYKCSLDYLIGLSGVQSPNADIQSACKYTGLSVEAIKMLHSDSFDIQSKEFICRLITEYGGDSHNIYAYIASAIESKRIVNRNRIADYMKSYPLKEPSNKARNAPPDGCETIPAEQAFYFKLSESATIFRKLLESFVDDFVQKIEPVTDAPIDENGPHFNDTWGYPTKEEE